LATGHSHLEIWKSGNLAKASVIGQSGDPVIGVIG
jgi:hypothetical protein